MPDNVYDVIVAVTDSNDNITQQTVSVSVEDEENEMSELSNIQDQLGLIGQDVGNIQVGQANTGIEITNIKGRLDSLELDPVTKTEVTNTVNQAISDVKGGAPEAGNTLKKLHDLILGLAAGSISFDNATANLNEADGTTAVSDVQGAIEALKRLSNTKAASSDLSQTQADLDLAEAAIIALQGKVNVAGTVSQAIADSKQAVKDEILNGAGAAFDTLTELKGFIDANAGLIEGLESLAATKVSFSVAQSLTAEQKTTARTNTGSASDDEFQAYKTAVGSGVNANAYKDARNTARGYA